MMSFIQDMHDHCKESLCGFAHECYNEATLARQMRTLIWEHIEQRWDEELALHTQCCPLQRNLLDGNNENENNNNNNEEGGESPIARPQQ